MEIDNTYPDFNTAIRWWERKRWIYNIITIFGGLTVLLVRGEVPNGLSPYDDYTIVLFYVLGANICYTFSWAFEAFLNYYFKISFWNRGTRQVFFVLGSILSFYWMSVLVIESF